MGSESVEFGREPAAAQTPIVVEPWPTEIPLFATMVVAALGLWLVLVVTIFGIVYAVFIGAALFFAHLLFVTHVRGSAVRLGPNQFPDLYRRVHELGTRCGLDPVPEAYVMQAEGSLNAFATRFLRSRIIVLFSDLLDACGDDTAARDMVIGHELGHHKAGHLRFSWLYAPGWIVPFLGAAYSRAREYTCDRYGAALSGDRRGALRGLAILAAGGHLGPEVNLEEFVRQRDHLDTGWMTLGRWLSTYPPLCDRVSALEPALLAGQPALTRGPLRAASLLGCLVVVPMAASAAGFAFFLPKYLEMMKTIESSATAGTHSTAATDEADEDVPEVDPVTGTAQVHRDFAALEEVIVQYYQANGELPADEDALFDAWESLRPGIDFPYDPFDGYRYGYGVEGHTFSLWSSGPDGGPGSDDDIKLEKSVVPGASG